MTKAQEWILRYIDTQFVRGSVRTSLEGDYTVRVTDRDGGSLRLTINLYGDIMDADTKEKIAECDVPHNLDRLSHSLTQEPRSWTNRPEWFDRHRDGGRTVMV